jgi:hypothetical protein
MKFKITLLCVFLSLIITSTACSQKVYFWKDERGITNATTTPPPDNIKEYQTDSFGKKSTPAEIEQFQRNQRASEARRESIRRANRAQEESRQATADARDRRADKVESDARKRLQFVREQGINLPQASINMLEKAAAAKAGQIRKGTDTPMSPEEDTAFHVEQEVRRQLYIDSLRPKPAPLPAYRDPYRRP